MNQTTTEAATESAGFVHPWIREWNAKRETEHSSGLDSTAEYGIPQFVIQDVPEHWQTPPRRWGSYAGRNDMMCNYLNQTELRGLGLRTMLTRQLIAAQGQVLTVKQLVDGIENQGFTIPGRASKTISDALRTEITHQRVDRVGRGRYKTATTITQQTTWRNRDRTNHFRKLLTDYNDHGITRTATLIMGAVHTFTYQETHPHKTSCRSNARATPPPTHSRHHFNGMSG